MFLGVAAFQARTKNHDRRLPGYGNIVKQMTIIGMTVESEGPVSGYQEAMVIFRLLF